MLPWPGSSYKTSNWVKVANQNAHRWVIYTQCDWLTIYPISKRRASASSLHASIFTFICMDATTLLLRPITSCSSPYSTSLFQVPWSVCRACCWVMYKPGPGVHMIDAPSRTTLSGTHAGSMHNRHIVCSVEAGQLVVELINQADYPNHQPQTTSNQQHTDQSAHWQGWATPGWNIWPWAAGLNWALRRNWQQGNIGHLRGSLVFKIGCYSKVKKAIIPKSLFLAMLAWVHSSHIGDEACYGQAHDTLCWPGMQSKIKDFVGKCTTCNKYVVKQQREIMMLHELPTCPWQMVSLDPFQHSGKDYLLLVNHYSDFWEIDIHPDLSGDTIINHCKAQFARYSQPKWVISDQPPVSAFCCELGIWSCLCLTTASQI